MKEPIPLLLILALCVVVIVAKLVAIVDSSAQIMDYLVLCVLGILIFGRRIIDPFK